jgi:hypothetical protein
VNEEAYPWSIPGIKQRLTVLRADLTLTCDVIAAMLSAEYNVVPGITKNAVIGKSRRMNLDRRDPQEFRANVQQKKRERKMTKRVLVAAPIEPLLPPRPVDGSVTIYQLGVGDCKFPLGAMGDYPPFMFCGKEQHDGSSYCADHFRICCGGQR